MENRATLSSAQRLKSRKLIQQLFAEGNAFSKFPFRVVYLLQDAGEQPLKAGFSASARNFKKATDRNRIKRLTKEAWRTQKPALETLLVSHNRTCAVFFIYTDKKLPVFQELKPAMKAAIERLQKLVTEKL